MIFFSFSLSGSESFAPARTKFFGYSDVTDKLVTAGIRAILNFAPARLKVPREVRLKNVDLSIELETLSFYLAQGAR